MAQKPLIEFDDMFGKRYKDTCQEVGNENVPDISGVQMSQIYRHISRKAEPALITAYRLCHKAGISLDWLARGRGQKYLADANRYAAIDKDFFNEVVEFVENFLKHEGYSPEYKERMSLVMALYNFEIRKAQEEGREPNIANDNVVDFMKYLMEAA